MLGLLLWLLLFGWVGAESGTSVMVDFHVSPSFTRVYHKTFEGDYQLVGVGSGKHPLTLDAAEATDEREVILRFVVPLWNTDLTKLDRGEMPPEFPDQFVSGDKLRKTRRFPAQGVHPSGLSLIQSLQAYTRRYPALFLLLGLPLPWLLVRKMKSAAPSVVPHQGATRIGAYELGGLLGSGGMSQVYSAVSPERSEPVALKLLRGELCLEESARARFEREIRVSLPLSHPNLAHLYDWGQTDDGRLYLACELLRGQTLKERLETPLEPREVESVLRQLGAALTYLHEQNLVHRDVKPSNVFLCEDGRLKLMDLGIARGLDLTAVTRTGKSIGTPSYMAPEQWRGEVCPASDQYALGVLAFELLSGEKPFPALEAGEVMYQHLESPIPAYAASGAVDAVLRRMLAKNPASRFPSIEEAVESLCRALSQSGDGDVTVA